MQESLYEATMSEDDLDAGDDTLRAPCVSGVAESGMVTVANALDVDSSHLPAPSRHRSYTLEFKLGVIQWVESHKCSLRAASKQFGVDRKVIRSWVDSRQVLLSALVHYGPHRRKLHNGKPPASHELDRLVLNYLVQQRREGYLVGDRELQRKALECAEGLGLDTFKATNMWLRGWKHRCNVETQNGTNEIVVRPRLPPTALPQVTARGSALLSHVSCSDKVKLTRGMGEGVAEDGAEDPVYASGPVYNDFSSREHSYCRTAPPPPECCGRDNLHQNTTLPGDNSPFQDNDSADAKLSSAVSLSPNYESANLFDTVIENIIVGDISELELPLGHEEIVEDMDFLGSLSPIGRTGGPLLGARGRGKTTVASQRAVTPVATFSMLDDPQGPSGLLASRLSQPVFPAAPEIVYVDMLGGAAHSTT